MNTTGTQGKTLNALTYSLMCALTEVGQSWFWSLTELESAGFAGE